MALVKWQSYLNSFEKTVMIPMYQAGIYNQRMELISSRSGKLQNTNFGLFIKRYFEYEDILALNYYGLVKLSTGLSHRNAFDSKRLIRSPVIHFNSVKIEHIEKFNSDLLPDFVKFKQRLVKLCWDR